MKIYKRIIGCILLVAMLVGTLNINVYAQITEDEALIQSYVESVNDEEWLNLPGLFCAEEEPVLQTVLSEESNRTNHVGVYNVTQIHDYEMYEMEDYEGEEYSDYCDVVEYLLYLDCTVNESDVFFKEGDNYFRLVIGTEGNARKILELSVAPDDCLEKITETNSEIISEAEYTEYTNDRSEVISSLEGYETIVVHEDENCIQGIALDDPDFSPHTISSYAFPSTIKIWNTKEEKTYIKDFREYCYVVCASEFPYGTKGKQAIHMNALRAFALCVRNVAWYRCLYPYDVTGGYNVTDNSKTQRYDWEKESIVRTKYASHVTAVNNIWPVMMFDCDKKLFYPSYRAGEYNDSELSDLSVFFQNGSNYLATELGFDYKEILHYYYDNAIGGEVTPGTIIICNYHNKATAYTARLEGHGQKCTTCGYMELISHTWRFCGSYYECTICEYRKPYGSGA